MRDVVVIGGGLSGLAAAVELESQGISYTLIEVKPRLGGGSTSQNVNGFVFDCGPMVHALRDVAWFTQYLDHLGLGDAYAMDAAGDLVFARGTGALVDALVARIQAPVLYRMAVSTLGALDERHFAICLENGMVLDSHSLIIAAPARYAERMLYTLVPEIGLQLLDYRYDSIARVSLAYTNFVPSTPLTVPEGYPLADVQMTTLPDRAPDGGVILQAALRYEQALGLPTDPVGEIAALMGWPQNPAADLVAIWAESDPVMWRNKNHPASMHSMRGLLPEGVALANSDFVATTAPPRLDERIAQGVEAARRVIGWLAQA
jgi:predicted NAD/FAD-dependent oxidoreductase